MYWSYQILTGKRKYHCTVDGSDGWNGSGHRLPVKEFYGTTGASLVADKGRIASYKEEKNGDIGCDFYSCSFECS